MQYISFWLLPEGQDEVYFQNIIHQLSKELHGPSFQPHLTLFSTSTSEKEEAKSLTEQVSSLCNPFSLRVTGVGISPAFTKSLFAQFAPTKDLNRLHKYLGEKLLEPEAYTFQPHISLVYQQMSPSVQRKLAQDWSQQVLERKTVTFDRVASMITNQAEKNEDVENWKRITISPLAEAL